MCTRVSGIIFIRYTQSWKIRNPNNKIATKPKSWNWIAKIYLFIYTIWKKIFLKAKKKYYKYDDCYLFIYYLANLQFEKFSFWKPKKQILYIWWLLFVNKCSLLSGKLFLSNLRLCIPVSKYVALLTREETEKQWYDVYSMNW